MTNITSEQVHDALMSELAGKRTDDSWSATNSIQRIFDRLTEENGYPKNAFYCKRDGWTITISYKRYAFATIKVKRQVWGNDYSYKDFEITLFYEQENAWNATTLEEFMIGVDALIAKSNDKKEKQIQLACKAYKLIRDTLNADGNDMYLLIETLEKNYFEIKERVEKGE